MDTDHYAAALRAAYERAERDGHRLVAVRRTYALCACGAIFDGYDTAAGSMQAWFDHAGYPPEPPRPRLPLRALEDALGLGPEYGPHPESDTPE